ncbi:FAD:protein FMN transferase [Bifidobacterium catenulatum]|uniref:FAD:protein FMN transferase n=1 Tax=Bifidobacterium catenulatum TaxID=1686 RepID=UPI003D33D64D
MDASVSLAQRMPYTTAFPKALGTGMVISADSPIDDESRSAMESLIENYEHVLSRFRNDSLIAVIGEAEHGGSFDFPDWCAPLFDLYDALFSATSGAIDPCVGEDLIRLGYDASMNFTVTRNAPKHLGALRGRSVWGHDVERHGTTLVTHDPVQLDFGACGKGYLVDLLGHMLIQEKSADWDDFSGPASTSTQHPNQVSYSNQNHFSSQPPQFVIDAGGDLLVHAEQTISVALEDPEDQSRAIGVAHIANGALCASAPSRRHWNIAINEYTQIAIHHLLNAIDGLPAQQTEASWTYVPSSSQYLNNSHDTANAAEPANATLSLAQNYPTAVADGLATALFVSDAAQLQSTFNFACATLNESRQIAASNDFPAELFLQSASRPHTSPNLKSKAAF